MFVQISYSWEKMINLSMNQLKPWTDETNNTRLVAMTYYPWHGGKIIEDNSYYSDPYNLVGNDFRDGKSSFNVRQN